MQIIGTDCGLSVGALVREFSSKTGVLHMIPNDILGMIAEYCLVFIHPLTTTFHFVQGTREGIRLVDFNNNDNLSQESLPSPTWRSFPLPRPLLYRLAACVRGDLLYFSGGCSAPNVPKVGQNDFFCYNPTIDTWSTLEPMHYGRCNHTLTAMGDYLYAFGGHKTSAYEFYCLKTATWIKGDDHLGKRVSYRHAAVVLAETQQLLITGGYINFGDDIDDDNGYHFHSRGRLFALSSSLSSGHLTFVKFYDRCYLSDHTMAVVGNIPLLIGGGFYEYRSKDHIKQHDRNELSPLVNLEGIVHLGHYKSMKNSDFCRIGSISKKQNDTWIVLVYDCTHTALSWHKLTIRSAAAEAATTTLASSVVITPVWTPLPLPVSHCHSTLGSLNFMTLL